MGNWKVHPKLELESANFFVSFRTKTGTNLKVNSLTKKPKFEKQNILSNKILRELTYYYIKTEILRKG